MTLKTLKAMLDFAEEQGHIKETDTVAILMNDGNGWDHEPIQGITAPTAIVKEAGKIKNQHPLFKPQIGFIRIEN